MTQLSAVVAEPMVEDAQEEAKQLGIVSSADTADVQAVKNPAANIFAPMSQYRADCKLCVHSYRVLPDL